MLSQTFLKNVRHIQKCSTVLLLDNAFFLKTRFPKRNHEFIFYRVEVKPNESFFEAYFR